MEAALIAPLECVVHALQRQRICPTQSTVVPLHGVTSVRIVPILQGLRCHECGVINTSVGKALGRVL
jgi:hypothetical protein